MKIIQKAGSFDPAEMYEKNLFKASEWEKYKNYIFKNYILIKIAGLSKLLSRFYSFNNLNSFFYNEVFYLKIIYFINTFVLIIFLMASLNAQELSKENNDELLGNADRQSLNSKDFNVFANLIVWTVKEAGADIWAEVITSDDLSSSNDLYQVNFGWDPGFRVGLGYKMKYDQWDTLLYYTWFHSIGKDHISSEPATIHSTFLGNFYVNNPDGSGLSGPSYQSANVSWAVSFNMFDWEIGKKFWINKPLVLHPFIGIKGGWIDQSIHSKWQNSNLSGAVHFNIGRENLKNNYWGIGPKAGINSKWNLYDDQSQFYLLGDFAIALMLGHWSFYDLFQNDLSQEVSVDLQNINGGSSMLQMFMGFGWDNNFSENKLFSVKLGYEMQFWLDQLQFYSFTAGRLVNILTLQGGTLELHFDF